MGRRLLQPQPPRRLLALLLLPLLAAAFLTPPAPAPAASRVGPLYAKKAAAKKGKGGTSSSGSTGSGPSTAKGFGAMGGGSSKGAEEDSGSGSGGGSGAPALMRDRATLVLMEWVGKHGGKIDSLGVATVGGGIRGVVALKVRVYVYMSEVTLITASDAFIPIYIYTHITAVQEGRDAHLHPLRAGPRRDAFRARGHDQQAGTGPHASYILYTLFYTPPFPPLSLKLT